MRHAVSNSTRKWSELSAEHEVRYTRNGRSFVPAMSKTSGVSEELLVCPVQRSDRSSRRRNQVGFNPVLCSVASVSL